MQLLEKILGNTGERHSKIVNLLDFKDEGETAFIFSLILHSCSQIDHCIYIYIYIQFQEAWWISVLKLLNSLNFYLELDAFSTLVINSGSGWQVPVGLEQLLWKFGSIFPESCAGFASGPDDTRSLVLVWLSSCILSRRHSRELQWHEALWRSSPLPHSPTNTCSVRNGHFCHCRNHVSMWENDPQDKEDCSIYRTIY